ncbi:MAG: PAS domain S-box protein, partial [Cyanobacteria bacterium HKST-UBA03]|nr:PAS domain S-box protein [Cyanobacteria bacterium HKST-UBA03]
YRMSGSLSDIDDFKAALAELASSKERFELAVDGVNDGVWDWDIATNAAYLSPRFKELMGYADHEMANDGDEFFSRLHPDDLPRVLEAKRQHFEEGKAYIIEFRLKNKDGHYRWYYSRGKAQFNDDGKPTRMVGSLSDIHDRKEAEQQLEFARITLDEIADPVFVKDRQHRWVLFNKSFADMIGDSPETLHMKTDTDYFPEEEVTVFIAKDEEVFNTDQTIVNEEELTDTNGLTKSISTSKRSFIGNDGHPYIVGSIRDITRQKESEALFIRAKEEAEKAAKLKSEFLATMTHEIRTPLNAVVGMVQLLQQTPLSDTQRQYIANMRIGSESLLSIINDILDFSRLESGRLELESRPFLLHPFIEGVFSLLPQSLISEKMLDIAFDISHDVPHAIEGDEARLRQILLNLLNNALKFTDTGSVTLAIGLHDIDGLHNLDGGNHERVKTLKFCVADTGIGIAKAKQGRLFNAFTQADSSMVRKYGGTGLGLSICKHLTHAMGGRIWLDSEEGQGARFYFTVQACVPNHEVIEQLQQRQPGHHHNVLYGDTAKRAPLNILVAEDNRMNQQVIMSSLKLLGYAPVMVASGLQAIEACSQASYDLVLMDIQMPDMDGLEATRRLLQDHPGLTIVAMTANVLDESQAEYRRVGFKDFLAKPFELDDLVALCQKWSLYTCSISNVIHGDTTVPSGSNPSTAQALVNFDKAQQLTGLDGDELKGFYEDFVRECPIDKLKQALAQKDHAAIARVAHELKGVFGLFQIPRLQEQATAIETMAKTNADFQTIEVVFETLSALFDEATIRIEAYMAQ